MSRGSCLHAKSYFYTFYLVTIRMSKTCDFIIHNVIQPSFLVKYQSKITILNQWA